MVLDWNWVLIVVGALLVLAELLLGGFAGFDLVLIGSAFLLGGGFGLVAGSQPLGFVLASTLCVAYVVAGRRWVRGRLRKPHLPSNTDALIGRRGTVVARVADQESGRIRLQGEEWRALPAAGAGPFDPGAVVTVEGVDGITLLVR